MSIRSTKFRISTAAIITLMLSLPATPGIAETVTKGSNSGTGTAGKGAGTAGSGAGTSGKTTEGEKNGEPAGGRKDNRKSGKDGKSTGRTGTGKAGNTAGKAPEKASGKSNAGSGGKASGKAQEKTAPTGKNGRTGKAGKSAAGKAAGTTDKSVSGKADRKPGGKSGTSGKSGAARKSGAAAQNDSTAKNGSTGKGGSTVSPAKSADTEERQPPLPPEPGVFTESDLAAAYTSDAGRKAALLVADGRYLEARDVLLKNSRQVASDRPLESRFLLAWACHRAGDWLCVETVTNGLQKDAPQVRDHVAYMRASAFAALGRNDSAISELATVGPDSAVSRDSTRLKAEVLSRMGRTAEAADILDQIVDSGDSDPDLISEFAAALMSAGKRDRAIQELRNAYFKSAWSGRSGFRGLLKKMGISVEASTRETMDQAWAQLNSHDSTGAIKTVEPLLKNRSTAVYCEAREILARANTKLRKHPEAFAFFKGVIDECGKYRDMPTMLFLGIRSSYRAGHPETGDAWTKRLSTEFPDATFNDDVAVMRARTAISEGRHDDATAILSECVKRWPNGDMADEARWLLAWGPVKAKKYAEAARRMEEGRKNAVNGLQFGSRFTYWNARMLQKSGRQAESRAVYEECAKTWPMTFYAVLSLNRLAEMDKTDPNDVLARLVGTGSDRKLTGPSYLTLASAGSEDLKSRGIPADGPVARAVWLARAGVYELAALEVSRNTDADPAVAWLKSLFGYKAGQFTVSHRAAKELLAKTPFWPLRRSAGYYRLAYPRPFADEVAAAAAESKIDPMLVWAVMREESAFVSGVESWANATGLMQLIMPTAESMAKSRRIKITKASLRDPTINTRLGATYLSKLLERFDNPIVAIPGYNAGGGAISRWLDAEKGVQVDEFVESIPASEARDYARKVFESYAAYRYLYADAPYRVIKVNFSTGGK